MPDTLDPHIAHFLIKVDGADLPVEAMNDVLEIVVESSLNLPDVCTIRIHDADFEWLDKDLFKEGQSIQVNGGEEQSSAVPLFYGEVTGLELDLSGHGVPTITARCYDRSHRLHRGRNTKTYVNVKDSDIFTQVVQAKGLQPDADETDVVHKWVIQNNQTDWEFLTNRAARNGFRLFMDGEKSIRFHKVEDKGSEELELKYGLDLRSFRPRVSATNQVDQVEVRGWDPKQKMAIVAEEDVPKGVAETGDGKKGGDVAKQAFGSAKMHVVDRPIHSTDEAQALAKSICDEMGGNFIEADGLCFGNPQIQPDVMVSIKNIGNRFSGKYYITSTTHTYTREEGYSTLFTCSGKSPSTLLGILGNGNSVAKRSELGGNIVVGIVTDNNDPDKMGRVKVKFPWLSEEHNSFWARTASQMAGKGRGMFNLPEINDEVLVAFEHGEMSRAYVLGQLWNGVDALPTLRASNPVLGGSGEVNRRGFYSRIGHKIDIDDTDGKGDMTLTTAGNNQVTLDDAKKRIEAKTTNGHDLLMDDDGKKVQVTTTGGHQILMDDDAKKVVVTTTAGHQIILDDNGSKITVKDPAGDQIVIEDSGSISIKANQQISLSAPNISISADLQLTMSGTQASLSGSATTSISGAVISMDGDATVGISAPMVNINS